MAGWVGVREIGDDGATGCGGSCTGVLGRRGSGGGRGWWRGRRRGWAWRRSPGWRPPARTGPGCAAQRHRRRRPPRP